MQQTLKRTRRSHVGHHCGLLTKNLCAVLKERWQGLEEEWGERKNCVDRKRVNMCYMINRLLVTGDSNSALL